MSHRLTLKYLQFTMSSYDNLWSEAQKKDQVSSKLYGLFSTTWVETPSRICLQKYFQTHNIAT